MKNEFSIGDTVKIIKTGEIGTVVVISYAGPLASDPLFTVLYYTVEIKHNAFVGVYGPEELTRI